MAFLAAISTFSFSLFQGLCVFIRANFFQLNYMISEIDTAQTDREFKTKLGEIVDYHNEILNLVAQMEDFMHFIIGGQFLVMGFVLCGNIFQMQTVAYFFFKYIFF